MKKIKQFLKLSLSCTNHRSLEKAVKKIIEIIHKSGRRILGPIPMPNRRMLLSLRRSPHVYHAAQDAFQLVYHKRVIMVYSEGGRQAELQDFDEDISSDVFLEASYIDNSIEKPLKDSNAKSSDIAQKKLVLTSTKISKDFKASEKSVKSGTLNKENDEKSGKISPAHITPSK